jgi:hypothetical protein
MHRECDKLLLRLREEVAIPGIWRIQDCMNLARPNLSSTSGLSVLSAAALFLGLLIPGVPARGQDAPRGPIAPPPERSVTRITHGAEPEAPPSLPEAEIIKRFTDKEENYLLARTNYTYRRTVRIQEFGPDAQPSGEYVVVTQPARDADGKYFEKVVERPHSSLQHLFLRTEDIEGLQRMPAFPVTAGQLAKYDLKYLGKEQVDEIDCYIFQAKPKAVERTKAYFDGIVWVDAKYLEVVKTYGKWVTDQGDMHSVAQLPFSLYETYRENVDGKFWFPNYSRSDDTLNQKGLEIPVRIVIKWTDFKPLPATPAAAASPVAPAPAPTKP